MRRFFIRWRYLGYCKETYLNFRPKLNLRNLRMLRLVCGIVAAAALFMAAIFGFVSPDRTRLWFCLHLVPALLAAFLLCTIMLRGKQAPSPFMVGLLIVCVSTMLYFFGIYLGTIASPKDYAVVIVWMLLFVQISFDTPPLQNLFTVLPAYLVFLLLSAKTKNQSLFFYDLTYSTMSMMVGLLISQKKSRTTMENIVAESQLRQANFALYHTSTTDELTGLPNRRQIFSRLDTLREECGEGNLLVACAVLDIDAFKAYNDLYGHPEGDELLRAFGRALIAFAEKESVQAGRIGGEEFLVVRKETDYAHAARIAEGVRMAIERLALPHEASAPSHTVTISAGLCTIVPQLADKAYYYADKALYKAKDAGKNKCFLYNADTGEYEPISEAPAPIKTES